MSKAVKEIVITAVMVIVLAVIVINNLKGAGKTKKATRAGRPKQLAEVTPSPAAVPADKKTLSLQRQRAENLVWGRDPFVYVEAETDRGYRTGAMELKGISLGKDKAGYAFINNEIVKAGDTVGGYDVLEIEKDKVLLKKGSQSFYLTLPEE
ncbi:MAG: hypothetical protein ABIH40_03835 [Candidatus Omnitrophota bacterium]